MRVFASALVLAVFGGIVTTSAPVAQGVPQPKPATILKPAEQSVIGTIDRFEEAARRLVLMTKEGQVAFVLATDVVVRLGSRVLPTDALATHHGRRAKVRFTQAGGHRTAHWVVISSEPPRIAN